jgi:hypothetical protein
VPLLEDELASLVAPLTAAQVIGWRLQKAAACARLGGVIRFSTRPWAERQVTVGC